MVTQHALLPAWDVRSQLNRDHQRLNRLFNEAVAAFRAGDRDQAAALWSQFDTGIRNHFDFEELHLIPQFRRLYPKAAAQLQAEHARVLSLLEELSVGSYLHLARADVVEDLITRLRAHADREDALLYRWAQARGTNVQRYVAPATRVDQRGARPVHDITLEPQPGKVAR